MEIYAFGDNSKGELGVLDKRQNLEVLTKIDTLEGTLLDITGDYYGIVLLDSKGNLYSLKQYETMPKQLSVDEKIISVVGAYYSYVALSESGNVWTWGGSNNYGQLGDGTKARRDKPKKITEEGGFESVYSGLYHCFALKPNGDLWGWGYGSLGSLGDGLGQDHTTPTLVLKDIDKVYQGLCSQTFVRMKDGRFMGFGLNNYGQLGTNNSQDLLSPVEIDFFKDKEVIQATTLSWANIVLTKDGKLYSAGYSLTSGQNTSSVFSELEFFSDKKVIKISSGYHFTVVLCENGDIYSFGEFTMGEINNRIAKVPINITEIPTFFKCGYSFGCFLGYFRDLENDFLNFFKAEEFTDLEIQGVKVHRQLVELRIGKTIDEKMIDHLTRYYETEIRAFMLWVYTGQYDKVKKDVVIEIIKELDIVERSKMSLSKFLSELLEDEDSSDFTILIPDPEDEEEDPIDIPVHKIVLMARSGLYREMFKKVKDKSTEVTDQSGMSPESVELLVKFLYTAKVSITADDDPETVVNELQDAKEYYQLNTNTSINVELQKIRREFKLI